ncbi:MAG: PAS domain-containing protein [Deltaproteobacteria bacterium]|jgi:iron only hydrogenase large subunit-like protein|nr:PAS domain-containing protein [Deltaproteobacteria bacterium]
MAKQKPVYTLANACQDCYKCLRSCAVKAITFQNGRASILEERCLQCGQCLAACPSRAKRIRDDLDVARDLVAKGEMVAVSLAPSWRGATGFNRARLVAALKALGVGIVGETALGAEQVTMAMARRLAQAREGLHISTACPVIVDYVLKYRPEFAGRLMPVASPALTHARLLKEHYGEEIRVVFVGPCAAKKAEADRHPDLLAVALTFGEMKRWLRDGQFDAGVQPIDEDSAFSPSRSHEGALYSLSGGMLEGLRRTGLVSQASLVAIASLDNFSAALDRLGQEPQKNAIFVEALACPGGCVMGPASSSDRSEILAVSDLLRHVQGRERVDTGAQVTVVPMVYAPIPLPARSAHGLEAIQAMLASLGKHLPEDEKNCSGCGYPSCRDLAVAILEGQAEARMCVSNMRRQAAHKASAMVRAMPSALVMVDQELNILEANEAFAGMFAGGETSRFLGRLEDLEGLPVGDFIEFSGLMRKVLRTGVDIQKEHFRYKKGIYNVYVFSVEKYSLVGAIVTDVTSFRNARVPLARKVREVLDKNIATVQEIACLLGEHMVETETILSTIVDDYDESLFGVADHDDEPADGRGEAG